MRTRDNAKIYFTDASKSLGNVCHEEQCAVLSYKGVPARVINTQRVGVSFATGEGRGVVFGRPD